VATLIGSHLAVSSAISAPVEPPSLSSFGTASHLRFGSPTGVPRGYFNLCRRGGTVCSASSGRLAVDSDGFVVLTAELASELRAVNNSVNRSIRPVNDTRGKDRWTVGGASGDCEDFALAKKLALIRKGWPSSSLIMALAQVSGQQHAVLVVRTTAGDFALDNLRDSILGWDRTGYHFEKAQSPHETWVWHTL